MITVKELKKAYSKTKKIELLKLTYNGVLITEIRFSSNKIVRYYNNNMCIATFQDLCSIDD